MYGETSDSSTAKARGNKRKKTFTEETIECNYIDYIFMIVFYEIIILQLYF